MNLKDQLEKYCFSNDLSCYDPYDIWKTFFGGKIKTFYYKHKIVFFLPATLFSLFDFGLNNRIRLFYKKQEYPIVRAFAAQILINLFKHTKDLKYKHKAELHLEWLINNSCKGYIGKCWGINFDWPAGKNLFYNNNTPLSTHTPYPLEAFINYRNIFESDKYDYIIKSIFEFYLKDLVILYENDHSIAFSYAPFKDRIIMNANSYILYALTMSFDLLSDQRTFIENRIKKLYSFIKENQLKDGSWLYDPFSNNSFIDCFHTCFIIKNLIKANYNIQLEDSNFIITRGLDFLLNNFYDKKSGLFRRFTKQNKPNFIKYDLYDNAEMLNLFYLLGDMEAYKKLAHNINLHFTNEKVIYSKILFGGVKIDKNTYRWAMFPYLYALSQLNDICVEF